MDNPTDSMDQKSADFVGRVRWGRGFLFSMIAMIIMSWWIPGWVESWIRMRPLLPGLAWEVYFEGDALEQDKPARVGVDSRGNVLLTGASFAGAQRGSWLAKFDGTDGRSLWNAVPGLTVVSAPVMDAQGSVLLAGSEHKGYRPGPLKPPFSGTDTDFAMCKVDLANGSIRWKDSFDGGLRDTDWAERIVLSSDGSPVAAGFTPDDTRYIACVAKMDATSGHLTWRHSTRDTGMEIWHGSVALTSDNAGDLIFASSRKHGEQGAGGSTFWLSKISGQEGNLVWNSEFPSSRPYNHILSQLVAAPNGDLIASGYHAKNRGHSLIVARFRGNDGSVVWSQEIEAGDHETLEPDSVVLDAASDILIAAHSWNGSLTAPRWDSWVMKLSFAEGGKIWMNRDACPSMPYAAGFLCSSKKLIIRDHQSAWAVGSVWNGRNVDVSAALLSGSDGTPLRQIYYDGAAGDHDLFCDAALVPSGELVVAVATSRTPAWLKPFKAIQYRLRGGIDWSSAHSESSEVDDADPYNYDCVLWQSRQSS